MSKRVSFLLLLLIPLLPGCLQVELNGPVAGAQIRIALLRQGTTVVEGFRSSDSRSLKAEWGTDEWAGFDAVTKAILLGGVTVPDTHFADEQYYLVTAYGGVDKDANNDGVIDAGDAIDREVHAIMKGSHLKEPYNRITLLSEAIYQFLEPEISNLNNVELGKRLNELSKKVVSDMNGDKKVTYSDVLQWSNFFYKANYKGSRELLARLPRALKDDSYDKEIVSLDGFNVVQAARYRPARVNTRWDDDLVGCNYAVTYGDLCNLETLSLMGMEMPSPTIPEIMKRVITSHDWMATRFQQVLNIMPPEVLLLFRSVTSVVIGEDIRPSFFSSSTGAINLDAENFWLTPAERATLPDDPDYRLEFANEVEFAHLWRYVKNNEDIFERLDEADETGYRELSDIELPVASLLLHELAHASDYFRSELLDTFLQTDTPYSAWNDLVSDDLVNTLPLESSILVGVADVLFFGSTPNSQEANYKAARIGDFFQSDRASDLYSYYTQFEDLAMLFEEAMMELLYGVQRDIAFTSAPPENLSRDPTCNDYKIGWGARGRIAESDIKPRVRLVLRALLPEKNYTARLNQMRPTRQLKKGRNWCDSVQLNSNASIIPFRLNERTLSPRQLRPRRYH